MQERKSATDDCQHSEDKNTQSVSTESVYFVLIERSLINMYRIFSTFVFYTQQMDIKVFSHEERSEKQKV